MRSMRHQLTGQRNPHGERPRTTRSILKSSSLRALGASRVIQSTSRARYQSSRTINTDTFFSYLGEVVLQAGPPLLAFAAVPYPARTLTLLSPLFTYALLRYASGVPPLEASAEKKWGSDPEWRKYTEKTSVLFPWPGGAGKGKL